jgi:folate-dependent phosphoribosylglycinamide formyltransferase PurN
MDAGPIVAQDSIAVRDGDTEETLAERVLEVEHRIYPRALRIVAEGRASLVSTGKQESTR